MAEAPHTDPQEQQRLHALARYQILDTPSEESFDRIARIATRLLEAPIALVSLVAEAHQEFKACLGLNRRRTDRAISFCTHAIAAGTTLVIPDATQDARFAENPLVTGTPHIRFYAGAPLRTPDGFLLGTLCVLDTRPRRLAAAQVRSLEDLAALVMSELELRREQAERAAAEDLYTAVVEVLGEGVVVHDAGGAIIAANPSAQQILGLSLDQLLGRTSIDPRWRTLHEDGTPFPGEEHPALLTLRTGQPQTNVVMGVERPGGNRRWIAINTRPLAFAPDGQPEQVVATFADITDYRRSRKALKASEVRYRLLAEHISDLILLHAPDGTIRYVSPSIRSVLGFTPEDLLGSRPLNLIHPDDHAAARTFRQQLMAGQVGDPMALRFLTRGGRYRWLEVATTPAFDHNGKVQALVSVARDVTQKQEAEAALRAAKDDAERANRMKSALLDNLNHEIHTPLTSILGFAKMLASDLGDPVLRDHATLIHKSAERLRETLNSLMRLAELEAGTLILEQEMVDVEALAHDVTEHFLPQARQRHLSLTLDLGPLRPLHALADRAATRQVLANLVSNAIKFTERGGITLRLAPHATPHQPPQIVIEIADTGIGIGPTFGAHVFEAFRQESMGLMRQYEGIGLGLNIAKRLVALMQGRIEVETQQGQGSVFRIYLPAAAAPPKRAPLHPPERPANRKVA